PAIKGSSQFRKPAVFRLRQEFRQKIDKFVRQSGQLFGFLPRRGISNQILPQAIPFVAAHFGNPNLPEEGAIGKEVDGVVVGPMRMRHEQMAVVANGDEFRSAEDQARILGLLQAGVGDRTEVAWRSGVAYASTRVSFDI